MLFKKVFVRWSAGENVDPANVPQPLKDYCQSLQDVPPQYEVFIGDPDIDSKTLHASAGFRDAYSRLEVVLQNNQPKLDRSGLHKNLVVNWETPSQHEISSNGMKWTRVGGTALKYEVTYTPSDAASQVVFMSIQFGA